MQKIITRAAILALLATGAQASAPTSIQPTDAVKAPAATPLLQEARRGRGKDDGAGHTRRGRGADDPVGHT